MSQPFIGEIRIFGGNFAPAGWALCEGQIMPIAENDTLFNLIGTTYGGDGQATFALPDLRGRLPVHAGTNPGNGITYTLAEARGTESETLTTQQLPIHTHALLASDDLSSTPNPEGNVLAKSSVAKLYSSLGSLPTTLASGALSPVGGSQPHTNVMPYLCVNFIISLYGVYPSPT